MSIFRTSVVVHPELLGSSQTFSLFPGAAGGEGDITWLKDNEELADEDKVVKVDEVSSKLFIRKAKLEDAGVYTCRCDFDSGHQDETQVQIYVHGET